MRPSICLALPENNRAVSQTIGQQPSKVGRTGASVVEVGANLRWIPLAMRKPPDGAAIQRKKQNVQRQLVGAVLDAERFS